MANKGEINWQDEEAGDRIIRVHPEHAPEYSKDDGKTWEKLTFNDRHHGVGWPKQIFIGVG